MTGFRFALIANAGERYLTLAVNFALIATISRILTPTDIGIAAIGATVLAIVECLRDVPTTFLVQKRDVDDDDRQTTFTAMAVITAAVAIIMLVSSGVLADAYGERDVAAYFSVLVLALLPGPFERPLLAMLRRHLHFGRLAIINIAVVAVNAATTLGLALAGFGYMSFAWGLVLGNTMALVLAVALAWEPKAYRFNLSRWRRALEIGAFATLSDLTHRAVELATYLIISRGARLDHVGLFSRAINLNALPEKLFVAGLSQIAFPLMSNYVRNDRDLKSILLRGISLTSALQMPAYAMLAILADPIVRVILGPQWTQVVPLLQIVALAGICSFATPLVQPAFLALGAFRDLFTINMMLFPLRLGIVAAAAYGGLTWLAWSVVARSFLSEIVSLHRLNRHIDFRIGDIIQSIRLSVAVTAATISGPLIVVLSNGPGFNMSTGAGACAAAASIVGWASAVWLLDHPIKHEIAKMLSMLGDGGLSRVTAPGRAPSSTLPPN